MSTVDRDAVERLLKRSRTDRGLPPRITDEATLARVAAVLLARPQRESR